MPQHTVTKLDKTQKGSPVVYFDNRHTRQDMVLLGNTQSPPLGAVIETEMASKHTDSGVELWFLNQWKFVEKPPQSAPNGTGMASAPSVGSWKPQTTVPLNAQPPIPSVAPSASEAVGYTDGERLTLSNWVAAAISSGAIKDCVDIHTWVNASLHALRNAKSDLWVPETPPAGPVPF